MRVKSDSPYLSKNMMSIKKQYHALLCFGVSGRYTTNCYPGAWNRSKCVVEKILVATVSEYLTAIKVDSILVAQLQRKRVPQY